MRYTPTALLLALASTTALADGDLMTRNTMTGDWGGLRQQLEDIQMVMAELEAAEQRCANSLNSLKTSAD